MKRTQVNYDTDIIRQRIAEASRRHDELQGQITAYRHCAAIAIIEPCLQGIFHARAKATWNQLHATSIFLLHQYAALKTAEAYEHAHTTRHSALPNRHRRQHFDSMAIIERVSEAAREFVC